MVEVGSCPSCGKGFCVLHEAYDFVPNLTPGTFEITAARLGWCQRCFTKLGPEGRKAIAAQRRGR
jgi:hypothetical protein